MKVAHVIQFAAFVATALAAVLAIDYGQEYTKAALLSPGINFEIVLTQDSKRKQPSAIGFKGKADSKFGLERVYGTPAVLMEPRFPSDVVLYHKRVLGGAADFVNNPDYKEYTEQRPGCMAVASNSSRNSVAFKVKDNEWTAEELVAMQFVDIKARADEMLKTQSKSNTDTVKDVVVTVPPHFTHSQRLALADAVDLAGLRLISMVSDGTATAVNYVSTRKFSPEKEYHVVYDMGAGSASATLFSVQDVDGTPVIDIEGAGYDDAIAGQAMTTKMVKILATKFMQLNKDKIDLQLFIRDVRAAAKLWKEAERAKAILSANQEVSVSVESVHAGVDFKAVVTREEYARAISDLTTRLSGPLETALAGFSDSPVELKNVKSVILTGGVTRTPAIQEQLKAILGEVPISKNVNTDESIVLGSLLRGVGISSIFKSRDIKVIDRSPHRFEYRVDVLSKNDEVVRSETGLLFDKGTPQGTGFMANLSASDYSNVNLNILEDGRVFARLDFRDVDVVKKELKCEEAELVVPFELTLSGTVKVSKAKVVCVGEPSVEKAEAEIEPEVETAEPEPTEPTDPSPESETGAKAEGEPKAEVKPKKLDTSRYIPHKTRFVGTKPLTAAAKLKIGGQLRSLARKDAERLATSDAANKLESTIYHIKHLIEDAEDQDEVAELRQKIEVAAEWFEEDGLTAGIEELKEKLNEVKTLEEFFTKAPEAEASTEGAGASGSASGSASGGASGDLDEATELLKRIAQQAREAGKDVPIDEEIERELRKAAEEDGSGIESQLESLKELQQMLAQLNGENAEKPKTGLDVSAISETIKRLSDKLTQLGKPPKDEDDMFRMLGIDPGTFQQFSAESFEEQSSPADQLMDSIEFLQQILAQDESADDEAAMDKMKQNIAERQERIAKLAEVSERNQKRKIAALENMLKDAEKSLDMSIHNLKTAAPGDKQPGRDEL